jgi:hypothetical protein
MPDSFKIFGDALLKNWPIYCAIFGAIVWGASMQAQQRSHAEMLIHIGNEGSKIKLRQIDVGQHIGSVDERTMQMQMQLQRIETKLDQK